MRSLFLILAATTSLHAQNTIRVPLGDGKELELVQLPAGKFVPVTRGQFARFVAATNYRTEAEKGVSGGFGWEGGKLVQKKNYTWRSPGFPQTDDHPVVMVDFSDAQAFCSWLSRVSGRNIALPTEAQWEYAARGGGAPGDAWTAANSPGSTKPVGTNSANGFGLHDMLGNAWEWCEDWFAPYSPDAATDPVQKNATLSDKPRRVLRGGAFSRPAADANPARRYRNDPGSRNADNGFRVVSLEAPPPKATPAPQVNLEAPASPRDEVPGRIHTPPEHKSVPHIRQTKSSSSGLFGYVILAGVAFIAWKILRKIFGDMRANPLRPSSVRSVPGSGTGGLFSIRVVDDGFWITGRVAPGTPLNVRWTGSSGTHTRTLVFQPSHEGHFVFTGERPTNISVTATRQQNDTDTDFMGGSSNFAQPPRHSSGGSRFSGYPPAY
jgi:formylglycine-generating enzyme